MNRTCIFEKIYFGFPYKRVVDTMAQRRYNIYIVKQTGAEIGY